MMKYNAKSTILWILLAVFGFGSLFQSMFSVKNPVVAKVGSSSITAIDAMKFSGFVNLPEGIDKNSPHVQNYIFFQALQIAIQSKILNLEAKRMGFVVSDERVRSDIQNDRNFCENDIFSRAKYLSYLEKINLSEVEYFQIRKEGLENKQLLFMLSKTIKVPKHVGISIANAFNQRRDGRFVKIDYSKISISKPSESETIKFYEKNSSVFKVNEKRLFDIITFPNQESAENASKELQKNYSLDTVKKHNGVIHDQNDSRIPEDLKNAASNKAGQMKKNEVSEQISLFDKHWVVRLKDLQKAFIPKFEEIKSVVSKKLQNTLRREKAIKSKIKPSEWNLLSNMRLDEKLSDVPNEVINALFFHKQGSMGIVDGENNTLYLVLVDKIKFSQLFDEEIENGMNIATSGIFNESLKAYIESLRLKYNVAVTVW
jgi:hypothetical protein